MGDFAVKFRVRSKVDGFNWALVAVYGAAQPELKLEFLADLVLICGSEQLPILVGGDFNIIRRREEKNNDNFDGRWSFMFNTIIEILDLREIELSGRKFTWANALPNPTYEKLDRVLASVEWEQKFPLVTVQALSRGISDHTPLFVDSEKKLKELLREEELKWALRAKVRRVVQGDANTQFFHLIANGKHRKKRIFQLEQDEGTILGQDNVKTYITEYYRQLFGPPEDSCVSLDESRTEDVPQLSAVDNDILVAPFSEKVVFDAIAQMKNNKAPGPDGFPVEFYKNNFDRKG
ncbi:uncharacterized protein [Aegilops tauschii subsp. strangulata]|uniref:uncharacterized protein n=1 Tax=Aegilops tauschii subsp. strangulata TaxID=200361 RepID=UPI003CC86BBC